jgi:hypothetical protein
MIPEENRPINLKKDLVNLATYRQSDRTRDGKPDPLVVYPLYAYDNYMYRNGQVVEADAQTLQRCAQESPNELVNKFGLVYDKAAPLLLHKKLADVLVDTAIDMRDRYRQFTVVMDGLRTYESGVRMQETRPDLVKTGLLAKAGTSAHNRALAVDSKLFELTDTSILDNEGRLRPDAAAKGIKNGVLPLSLLREADEKGHLDDVNMDTNSRFYNGDMSETARTNRLNRLQSWHRASVKNKVPVANLLSEFWDDRVCGSPADLWRVLSCRALCIGADGNPKTNPVIARLREDLSNLQKKQELAKPEWPLLNYVPLLGKAINSLLGAYPREQFATDAHERFTAAWNQVFAKPEYRQKLEAVLGKGGSQPPSREDFASVFHEWMETIHDDKLQQSMGFRQATARAQWQTTSESAVHVAQKTGRVLV